MKLACADFAFPLLPFEKSIELIAMLGFDGVDVGVFAGGKHLLPGETFGNVSVSARRVTKLVASHGLAFADIHAHPEPGFEAGAPNNPDASVRKRARQTFLRVIEFVARCGSKHVTMVPGIPWKKENRRESLHRCAEEMVWRCERAREAGVVFGIEPHFGSIADTPARAMELLRAAPGLTLTLDYSHFTLQGFTDGEVEPLLPHASHIHARTACRGKLQASMKQNTIDFKRMAAALKRQKYRGYVEMEYVWIDWQGCNEVDNLSETILLRDVFAGAR